MARPVAKKHEARVGVDIGGTFTDIVVWLSDGTLHISKVSSTPLDPGVAVIEGLAALLEQLSIRPEDVKEIVHGTTVGSNTILQRTGARTGLITTKGFRDVLEIGRIRTPTMFDLGWAKPVPLVPRRHRLELNERIGSDGTVVRRLDPEELVRLGERLVEEEIETVAICFLNSFANPVHEKEARRILAHAYPQLEVTTSCDVLPEIKEYERTSTVVVNAYLLKSMRGYLATLDAALRRIGIEAPLLVLTSNGGMMGVDAASEKPVFAVASGPAGGVAGAARLARASFATRSARDADLIVFDMGGTTAKASMVENGSPMLNAEYEFRDGISSPSRFIKGGGYVLKVPSIDIAEVGAGGGSIAFVDAGGVLQVGPESAGADPGPACYAQGSDRPTVTDANVVLGYFNPDYLTGGSKPIVLERAAEAIRIHIAEPLGLGLTEAAHGIREVANFNMARAIRSITVERGRDARLMKLMAFGGSGPAHAADVARLLGIKQIIVPMLPGVFCSVGMLASDVEHNFVRTVLCKLTDAHARDIHPVMAGLRNEGLQMLLREGYHGRAAQLELSADLRYVGQSSELTVPLPNSPFTDKARARLHASFQNEYVTTFGYSNEEPVELVNIRLAARGVRANRLSFEKAVAVEREGAVFSPKRKVLFGRSMAPRTAPVIRRSTVSRQRKTGPAIVESYDSTLVIPPRATFRRDARGSILIELG